MNKGFHFPGLIDSTFLKVTRHANGVQKTELEIAGTVIGYLALLTIPALYLAYLIGQFLIWLNFSVATV